MARNIRQADEFRALARSTWPARVPPRHPVNPSGRRDADVTTTPLPPVVDEPTWRRQLDLLPYGRQEEWQDVPEGWPQAPAYSRWWISERYARYGEDD
jgi:hypothetical protein